MEDHSVILCAALVAGRGSAALTSEDRVLKAFLGSVHWKGLELVINNCLMDFSTLTSSHVASGRNLLLEYVHKNATSLLTLVSLSRLCSFCSDSFPCDFGTASRLWRLERRPRFGSLVLGASVWSSRKQTECLLQRLPVGNQWKELGTMPST